MVIETTSELYYTVRSKFMDGGSNWHHDYTDDFKQMLCEYGAWINTSKRDPAKAYACDHLSISPGIDVIEFSDEKKYTMFLLRWS